MEQNADRHQSAPSYTIFLIQDGNEANEDDWRGQSKLCKGKSQPAKPTPGAADSGYG